MSGGKGGDVMRRQSLLLARRDSEDFGFCWTQPVLFPALYHTPVILRML